MAATGVADLADRFVDELSGGQRQRVWIAMALAQQTPLLLLDEPTTYLDIAHQIEVLDLCARLHGEQGRTLVAVLHDLNHAARYATHLIAMRDGRVVAAGPAGDIVTAELVDGGLRAALPGDRRPGDRHAAGRSRRPPPCRTDAGTRARARSGGATEGATRSPAPRRVGVPHEGLRPAPAPAARAQAGRTPPRTAPGRSRSSGTARAPPPRSSAPMPSAGTASPARPGWPTPPGAVSRRSTPATPMGRGYVDGVNDALARWRPARRSSRPPG